MSLSTSLLGPYDNTSTADKTIVSAAIPPDVKERLFVEFLPRRGAVDKIISRQLHIIDAFFVKHGALNTFDEDVREATVNNLLNAVTIFLDNLEASTLLPEDML